MDEGFMYIYTIEAKLARQLIDTDKSLKNVNGTFKG